MAKRKKSSWNTTDMKASMLKGAKWTCKNGAKAAAVGALTPIVGRYGAILGAAIIVDQFTHVKIVK